MLREGRLIGVRQADLAGDSLADAEQGLGQGRPPGADEPGQAQDFAAVQLE